MPRYGLSWVTYNTTQAEDSQHLRRGTVTVTPLPKIRFWGANFDILLVPRCATLGNASSICLLTILDGPKCHLRCSYMTLEIYHNPEVGDVFGLRLVSSLDGLPVRSHEINKWVRSLYGQSAHCLLKNDWVDVAPWIALYLRLWHLWFPIFNLYPARMVDPARCRSNVIKNRRSIGDRARALAIRIRRR